VMGRTPPALVLKSLLMVFSPNGLLFDR